MPVLEARLEEVEPCLEQFAQLADSDQAYAHDAEGTLWTEATSQGLWFVSVLESNLEEVTKVYLGKFGQSADSEQALRVRLRRNAVDRNHAFGSLNGVGAPDGA